MFKDKFIKITQFTIKLMKVKAKKFKLANSSEVKYVPNFLSKKEAKDLFKDLKDNVPWTYGIYKMYGKEIKTPRLL